MLQVSYHSFSSLQVFLYLIFWMSMDFPIHSFLWHRWCFGILGASGDLFNMEMDGLDTKNKVKPVPPNPLVLVASFPF